MNGSELLVPEVLLPVLFVSFCLGVVVDRLLLYPRRLRAKLRQGFETAGWTLASASTAEALELQALTLAVAYDPSGSHVEKHHPLFDLKSEIEASSKASIQEVLRSPDRKLFAVIGRVDFDTKTRSRFGPLRSGSDRKDLQHAVWVGGMGEFPVSRPTSIYCFRHELMANMLDKLGIEKGEGGAVSAALERADAATPTPEQLDVPLVRWADDHRQALENLCATLAMGPEAWTLSVPAPIGSKKMSELIDLSRRAGEAA